MKNLLFIASLLMLTVQNNANAQIYCSIDVTPLDTTICPGDSVFINSTANLLNNNQYFDFNAGILPSGWSVSGTSTFSEPCGSNNSGTPYYWAATSTSSNPSIATASYDITCGGVITFDMVYAIQSGSSPCEGPDEADEGVSLQYSTDGGLTWITIVYYSPDGTEYPANPFVGGGVLPPGNITNYTSWGSFNVQIPAAALSTGTMFQWIQESPTSGSAFDNWGIDNIIINSSGTPCGSAIVDWSNGYQDTTSFFAVPASDTSFVAYVYDTLGILQCISDTITITIIGDNMAYDLVDSAFIFCPDDSSMVEILNMQGAQLPVTTDWTTGSTTTDTWLPGSGLKHDTIWYYVDLVDGCGYTRTDSVVLLVNQTLTIDSLMQFPTSACAPDGAVTAFVSGETNLLGQSYYHWDDQQNWDSTGTGSFIDATAWQGIGSGWYFFTVSDDVCTESDSVFVEMNNPPMASVTATPDNGCNPVGVTLSNDSQNANEYYWDFGNGNTISVSDMGSQSQVYSQSSVVMLIAYSDPTCADTAYVNISVTPCGCTDPDADNYDPSATFDDGSCTYPIPVVTPPNVFTPNNDGDNDVYFLQTKNVVTLEFTVLNRWGNVMYDQTIDLTLGFLELGWNGTTPSGTEAEEGTYFYKYVATGINGDQVDGHGFIQLVRD